MTFDTSHERSRTERTVPRLFSLYMRSASFIHFTVAIGVGRSLISVWYPTV